MPFLTLVRFLQLRLADEWNGVPSQSHTREMAGSTLVPAINGGEDMDVIQRFTDVQTAVISCGSVTKDIRGKERPLDYADSSSGRFIYDQEDRVVICFAQTASSSQLLFCMSN